MAKRAYNPTRFWPEPVTSASTSAATTPSNTPNKKPKIELLTDF